MRLPERIDVVYSAREQYHQEAEALYRAIIENLLVSQNLYESNKTLGVNTNVR